MKGEFVGESENLDVSLEGVVDGDIEGSVGFKKSIREDDCCARGQMTEIIRRGLGGRRKAAGVTGVGMRVVIGGIIGVTVVESGEVRKVEAVRV